MRAAARAKAQRAVPLEYNLLLTATLCLLAFGAVMVYSASSARALLQGQGDGTGFLVRYLTYGGLGLIGMHVVARRGLDGVLKITTPLLVFSFVCLLAVKVPGVGVTVNGARRWLGAGPLQFQPSEIAKLALVLYGAMVLAKRPGRIRSPHDVMPLLLMAGTAVLLVASQPDLGTALVMSFTVTAMLVAAGMPIRFLAIGAGALALLVLLYALSEPYRRARLTTFLDSGRAGCSAAASASRCRRSSTSPRPTPTSSSRSSARSSGWPGSSACCASTACSPTPACGSPSARPAPTRSCSPPA
jgi:cell division protein FtsW